MKLNTDNFLSANFGNDMSSFFVNNSEQELLLFEKLLGCIDSYSGPHSIWTCPWLAWKTLFVKLHTEIFWAQILATTWVIFSKTPQNFFLFQNLIGCIYSYSNPSSIWTCPWLDWKSLLKLHTDNSLRAKFDNDISTFFRRQPRSKNLSAENLLGCTNYHSGSHSVWTSP